MPILPSASRNIVEAKPADTPLDAQTFVSKKKSCRLIFVREQD
jgi:hypothetical protein